MTLIFFTRLLEIVLIAPNLGVSWPSHDPAFPSHCNLVVFTAINNLHHWKHVTCCVILSL